MSSVMSRARSIAVQLEDQRAAYEPGALLRGSVTLTPAPGEEDRKVELSVLWQTEGKGNTDIGVALHRVLAEDGAGAHGSHAFETRLPLLPLSYTGALIKIRWLVRVRRYAPLADDEIEEREIVVRWPT